MDLEQWAVGGRGFGWIFVFLLLAGEIYTTFTFLGASGFSYGQGAPVYYILAYGSLAYVIAYFLLPLIWSYARQNGLHSQPDFFVRKYASPTLGVLVSVVDLVALIPYLVLQLTGLGIIVTAAGYGAIPRSAAISIGAAIVTVYVMMSGIRGSAYTAVVKDILILCVALFLGIYLPLRLYGGVGPMFEKIAAAKPGFLVFPATGQSVAWFISTVLLTAIGFFMWPHSFAACYSAKDARVFRRNAIVLPIYQLILLFVFFVGFAAVLQVPGLKGADTNLALFKLATQQFSLAVVGMIGAAGVFTALVPGSLIAMTAAMLLTRRRRGAHRGADRSSVAQHQLLARSRRQTGVRSGKGHRHLAARPRLHLLHAGAVAGPRVAGARGCPRRNVRGDRATGRASDQRGGRATAARAAGTTISAAARMANVNITRSKRRSPFALCIGPGLL